VKPLEGLVVLDLTRYLAGPYCTLLLGGLGAEVIKVEPPGTGDAYRERPPFGGPKGAHLARQTDEDIGLMILHRARNKKSVTLNLRHPEGLALLRRLCATADVLVENFLPGTLDTMGLGFATLQAWNPRLVLCSISGFGQGGPYREWRAFDPIVQAMSGISSVTGYPDRPPVRCGASIGDTAASLYGVIGILSALRARDRTGQGDWVDVSMLDGSFFLLADVLEFVVAGVAPERLGNAHPGVTPFNVYRAADGWVALCAVTARDWHNVLRALGREELAADPRFDASPLSRRQHREEIDALVGEWVGDRTVDAAVEVLQAHDVPAGPVRGIRELLADEHLAARRMVVDLEHPVCGPMPGVKGVGVPIKFTRYPAAFDGPAPELGAHNVEVYGRLGLDEARLETLRREGVI
jgi:crotonobetainyl-CoA:carnitine CoA-transferase CaiB-like acyl-CoA transferase